MNETLLVTVLLKHDQSKNLEDIQRHMKQQEWWERFPPQGVELERSAWGVFSTEVFPTYDFIPVRETIRERVRNGGQ